MSCCSARFSISAILIVILLNVKPSSLVQLTLKQGLIMNQVIDNYVLHRATGIPCKNHSNQYKAALRNLEPWAIKMFDSSSKLQFGILSGNLVEFGDFNQCIDIQVDEFSGKFCHIKITPSLTLIEKVLAFRGVNSKRFGKVKIIVERAALYWAICVPNSCSALDIFDHFNRSISELSQGLNLTVSLEENQCFTKENYPKFGSEQYVTLFVIILFLILSLICTSISYMSCKKYSSSTIVDSFCLITNYKRIISNGTKGDLDCLYGIRFLSIYYVIIGHRYLMAMYFPLTNGLDNIDWIIKYSSSLILGGTVSVDSFFLMSGLLVSHNFFKYVSKHKTFNLFLFYAIRYLRLTPCLAIVVLIYATLIQYLGSGPLWKDTVYAHQKPCRYFWWSTLLHIQSYINPESLCIIQTWSLTCDMCFYYFSPIILYPLWKFKIFGYINYTLFYIASVAISFYLAWINEYEGGMPATNQLLETHYFRKHYIAPHTRAPPYIIGLGFGYALFRLENQKIKISGLQLLSGWVITLFFMASSVMFCRVFQLETHEYNRVIATLYISCSRSLWTFGLVWIIWVCRNGYGGIVNSFLSCYMFRVLSKLVYAIFLLHFQFQFLKNGNLKTPNHFSDFQAIYESQADVVFMVGVGLIFTLFFELPLERVRHIIFSRLS